MSSEQIQAIKQLLASPDSLPQHIVITSHRNPDGDAIGSSLGLYHYLLQYNHQITVVFPSDYPTNFTWMPDADSILIYDNDLEAVRKVVAGADIIFALDYNSLERVDKLGELIAPTKAIKIMIDHHLYPDSFAQYMLSDTSASSTSELIVDFIRLLDDWEKMNPAIGDCLYTGIVTDTGSFKFSTSPKLFHIVADLLAIGVNDAAVQDLIYNCVPEKNLRLLGYCLYERMEILPDLPVGIISLTKQDYERFDIQRGETEGIVNYMLSMKPIQLAVFVAEQPTITKLSMRSKGDLNVQRICSEHFKGGGHKNASGGSTYQNLKTTITKLKEILPLYLARYSYSS